MPRQCTICTHPKRDEIDQALVGNGSFRDIAGHYSVSRSSLERHKADHLPAQLAQATEAKNITSADHLTAELHRIMRRVNLLFDACDRWLRDVDNPEQYDIGLRTEDPKVTYLERMGDRVVRRKERLSVLLPQIEDERGISVIAVESKYADPRQLVLNASGKLGEHLELLAKLLGKLQEKQVVNILLLPEWVQIRNTVVAALELFPEARIAVADALIQLDETNGQRA